MRYKAARVYWTFTSWSVVYHIKLTHININISHRISRYRYEYCIVTCSTELCWLYLSSSSKIAIFMKTNIFIIVSINIAIIQPNKTCLSKEVRPHVTERDTCFANYLSSLTKHFSTIHHILLNCNEKTGKSLVNANQCSISVFTLSWVYGLWIYTNICGKSPYIQIWVKFVALSFPNDR